MSHRATPLIVLLLMAGCQRSPDPAGGALLRHDGPVVLITIDTLRADRVGLYGSARGLTPVLDGLGQPPRGVVMEDATAQTPLTLPSHATIMTGLHPPRHGVRTNDGFILGTDAPTLAGVFGRAGYATAAFIGAAPVAAATGLGRGFDVYDETFLQAGASERRADDVLRPALAWMRAEDRGAAPRFFAWIHLFDPHSPYDPPAAEAAAHHAAPYDGEVAYTDAALGRFMDALRQDGLADRVLFLIVADHGESLGEHGERTHGTFLYDSTIRVPMIVRLPATPHLPVMRARVSGPVEIADIAPTLAAVAGLRLGDTDGRDIRDWLAAAGTAPENGPATRKAAYAETLYQHVLLGWSPLRALRGPDWKFIEAPTAELYDLARDPGETTNVIDQRPQIARAMAALLPPPVPPGTTARATRETTERLQSLGYVTGRTVNEPARGVDPKDRIEVWNAIEEGIDFSTRDPGAAEAAFRRAERLDPSNGLVLKYLGDIAFRARAWSVAADRYRRAMTAGFQHPDVYVNLASIDERAGRRDAARRLLAAAVEAHPSDADAWNRLGLVEARSGDDTAARRAFEQARALAPDDAEAYYHLALVDRRAGREAAARARLQEALARNPRHVEARFELATSDLAAGDASGALAGYRMALQHRPDYPEALFGAARAALDLGRRDDARAAYEHFIRVAPREYAPQVAAARRMIEQLRNP